LRLDIKAASDSFHEVLVQRPTQGEIGVFTLVPIVAGALIVPLLGTLSNQASKRTIQIDDTLHLDESDHIVAGVNHSCDPNAYLDFSDPDRLCIRASIAIAQGSEVTIDYCASEEQLAEPFECWCSSRNCYGTIRGYAFLSAEQRGALEATVSPYLLRKYRTFM
jgi:hypothetical protein